MRKMWTNVNKLCKSTASESKLIYDQQLCFSSLDSPFSVSESALKFSSTSYLKYLHRMDEDSQDFRLSLRFKTFQEQGLIMSSRGANDWGTLQVFILMCFITERQKIGLTFHISVNFLVFYEVIESKINYLILVIEIKLLGFPTTSVNFSKHQHSC